MIFKVKRPDGKLLTIKAQIVNVVPITKKVDAPVKPLRKTHGPNASTKVITINTLPCQLGLQYTPHLNAGALIRFKSHEYGTSPDGQSNCLSFCPYTTGSINSPGKKQVELTNYNFDKFLSLMMFTKQLRFTYDPQTLLPITSKNTVQSVLQVVKKQARISNIVTVVYYPYKIDLTTIKKMFPLNFKYIPAKFPGGDLKFQAGEKLPFNVTIVLYGSGKCVILGVVNRYQIKSAFKMLCRILYDSEQECRNILMDASWVYTNNYLNNRVPFNIKKGEVDTRAPKSSGSDYTPHPHKITNPSYIDKSCYTDRHQNKYKFSVEVNGIVKNRKMKKKHYTMTSDDWIHITQKQFTRANPNIQVYNGLF